MAPAFTLVDQVDLETRDLEPPVQVALPPAAR
jgi:hypothetical protein